jgi:hypothetical protein
MNEAYKPAQFSLQGECRDAVEDEAGDEQGKPEADAAKMVGVSHGDQ